MTDKHTSCDDEPMKHCPRCDDDWPATPDFFFRHKGKPDGFRRECKACYYENPSVKRRGKRRAQAA